VLVFLATKIATAWAASAAASAASDAASQHFCVYYHDPQHVSMTEVPQTFGLFVSSNGAPSRITSTLLNDLYEGIKEALNQSTK
jgi:hypothetical protein